MKSFNSGSKVFSKIKLTIKILIVSFCIFYSAISIANIEAILGIPLKENKNLAGLMPTGDIPEIIISRDQYVISYNKERRSPNWVAWELELSQMGSSGRSPFFLVDSELELYLAHADSQYKAVDPTEFIGSCFDRGHQVPSADRSDTHENNQITFLMSNIVPQTPFLNRVIWEHLEKYTRDLVRLENKKVFIITGPIFSEDFGSVGPLKNILIPSAELKILIVLDADQSWQDIKASTSIISVIMPNRDRDGSPPTLGQGSQTCKPFISETEDWNDWQDYKASVEEIERLSGLTIFSKIL